ncbi:hypothetical protein EUGRSUZ_D00183 [Eucalyptus grandis]|uniref:Uncharacterized protein n=2 Tax=Eucalyptus grandis TaxID=71139 RepID=A0ACC3L2F2_EUCGR|nr:hypothetical protein EUGRSUZ_D00183 [Eucalyptus grandis]
MGQCAETERKCPLLPVVLLLTHPSSFAFGKPLSKWLFHCFYSPQPSKRRLVPVPIEIDQTCPRNRQSPCSLCLVLRFSAKGKNKGRTH